MLKDMLADRAKHVPYTKIAKKYGIGTSTVLRHLSPRSAERMRAADRERKRGIYVRKADRALDPVMLQE